MDNNCNDISVHLPAEYFDVLSEVIATGLEKTKLKPHIRNALRDWWQAEQDYILEQQQ